ncbi:MAG: NUDIX domain-containing protein [Patescibacteria group bacterium]|nr:NUDIX domain-containing protein [Patescibacteria group bacterium]MDD4304711.1 NUDIX domain-containing protein [Patescibacteria group bacterium]MDD4695727.1 NUDIX domain-containing protein [Patescibacteria group bacterium]
MYDKKNKLHIVSVVAVIRGNNKYLVLKRPEREVAYPNMYTFPGGKVENNDTIEETGLKLKSGKILLKGKSFTRTDGQTVKVFSYLCSMENIDNLKLTEDFV